MFVAGRISSLMALVVIFLSMSYAMSQAKTKLPTIRRIAGLEAIDEAVGRATEMGKSVFLTPGWADITGDAAGPTFAALDILAHVANLTAKFNTKLVVAISYPNVYPLAYQTVQQAYMVAGKADAFDPDMIRFTSSMQYAYMAACLGMIQRENCAATILVGAFASEAVNFAESSVAVGAMSIAGSTSTAQLPYFAASCDYTMLGEELLAAGAYLSKDARRIGSVRGQDIIKMMAMCILVLGVLLRTAGNTIIVDLLKK